LEASLTMSTTTQLKEAVLPALVDEADAARGFCAKRRLAPPQPTALKRVSSVASSTTKTTVWRKKTPWKATGPCAVLLADTLLYLTLSDKCRRDTYLSMKCMAHTISKSGKCFLILA